MTHYVETKRHMIIRRVTYTVKIKRNKQQQHYRRGVKPITLVQ